LRNNFALVLVSAMSDYASIVYRACNEKNCRALHSDFPNCRLTVVTLLCLSYCTCFPFWKTYHHTRWRRGRAGLHTLQRGLGVSEVHQTPPPPLCGPLVCQDLQITESSRSHSGAPHLVGLLLTSDQPDGETLYLTTHNTHKRKTCILEQAMNAQRASIVIAVLFLKPRR